MQCKNKTILYFICSQLFWIAYSLLILFPTNSGISLSPFYRWNGPRGVDPEATWPLCGTGNIKILYFDYFSSVSTIPHSQRTFNCLHLPGLSGLSNAGGKATLCLSAWVGNPSLHGFFWPRLCTCFGDQWFSCRLMVSSFLIFFSFSICGNFTWTYKQVRRRLFENRSSRPVVPNLGSSHDVAEKLLGSECCESHSGYGIQNIHEKSPRQLWCDQPDLRVTITRISKSGFLHTRLLYCNSRVISFNPDGTELASWKSHSSKLDDQFSDVELFTPLL